MSGVRESSFVKTPDGQVELAYLAGRAKSNRRILRWPARHAFGAMEGNRTLNLLLGKETFYP